MNSKKTGGSTKAGSSNISSLKEKEDHCDTSMAEARGIAISLNNKLIAESFTDDQIKMINDIRARESKLTRTKAETQ